MLRIISAEICVKIRTHILNQKSLALIRTRKCADFRKVEFKAINWPRYWLQSNNFIPVKTKSEFFQKKRIFKNIYLKIHRLDLKNLRLEFKFV